MAKIKVIAKPIFSFIFTSDQIEGVCFSIGELLTFNLPENISSVSELGSKSWSCGPELQSWRKKKQKQKKKHKYINDWQRKDYSNFCATLYWFISNVSAYSFIAYVVKPLMTYCLSDK